MTMQTAVPSGEQMARAWREPLGRAGLAARGVLYVILGVLAIQFARGEASSDQVSQTGAIETVAEQPFGKFLLVALTVGFIALFLWRAIQAVVGDPVEGDDAKDRIKFAGKAVIYAVLAVTSIKITIDNWSGGSSSATSSGNGDQSQQKAASTLFDLPAGRYLVALLGLVFIGAAIYEVYHHTVEASFMKRVSPPAGAARFVELIGRIGYAARSVVWAIIGVFFVVAAVQYDAEESKGLSGSLQELAEHSWGRVVLWAVAIGFALFGVFCLAESRYRRRA